MEEEACAEDKWIQNGSVVDLSNLFKGAPCFVITLIRSNINDWLYTYDAVHGKFYYLQEAAPHGPIASNKEAHASSIVGICLIQKLAVNIIQEYLHVWADNRQDGDLEVNKLFTNGMHGWGCWRKYE